jgi:hypothetical protein
LGSEISAIGYLLEDLIEVFPVLDTNCVERKHFFESPGLRLALALLQIPDRSFGYSGELDDLGLRQLCPLSERFQLVAGIVL